MKRLLSIIGLFTLGLGNAHASDCELEIVPVLQGTASIDLTKYGFKPFLHPERPIYYLKSATYEYAASAFGSTLSPWYVLQGPQLSVPGKVSLKGYGTGTCYPWAISLVQFDPLPIFRTTLSFVSGQAGQFNNGGIGVNMEAEYRPGAEQYNYCFSGGASFTFTPQTPGTRIQIAQRDADPTSEGSLLIVDSALSEMEAISEEYATQSSKPSWTIAKRDHFRLEEYKTKKLIDDARAIVTGAEPTGSVVGTNNCAQRYLYPDQDRIYLRKLKAAFVFNTIVSNEYVLRIPLITVSEDGSTFEEIDELQVTGDGTTMTKEYIVMPPAGNAITYMGRVFLSELGAPCHSGRCLFKTVVKNKSVEFSIDLGTSKFDKPAGFVGWSQEWVDPSMFLRPEFVLNEKVVARELVSAVPRSAWSESKFVEVLPEINPQGYSIRLFTLTNGVVITNGHAIPMGPLYSSWRVSREDGLGTVAKLTETRGGRTVTNVFANKDDSLELIEGNGTRRIVKTTSDNEINGNVYRIKRERTFERESEIPVSEKTEVFQVSPHGALLTSEMFGSLFAPDLINNYVYTEQGLLSEVHRYDGYWELNSYDEENRLTKKVSPFGNLPFGSTEGDCIVTEYDYSPSVVSGSGDNGSVYWISPRLVTQSVPSAGLFLSKKYTVYLTNEIREIICTSPTALWDDTNNLVTVTKRIGEGRFAGKIASVTHPDGTFTLYHYEINAEETFMTNTVATGTPNTNFTAVIDGVRQVQVINPAGDEVLNETYDVVTGILIAKTEWSNPDPFGRLQTATHLDGSTESKVYGCCGIEESVDRTGARTEYTYDDLKRVTSVSQGDVTRFTAYNAVDQPIRTTLVGTNGANIVESRKGYDLAGRLIAETNAVGVVTTYSEDFDDAWIRTTTYAAGTEESSTVISATARDGVHRTITGTAVHGIRKSRFADGDRIVNRTIYLDANGDDSDEWQETITDQAGRIVLERSPVNAAHTAETVFTYNASNQISKITGPDGITTLYTYRATGERLDTVIDMDRDGLIDFDGADRITRSETSFLQTNGLTLLRTTISQWLTNNTDSATIIGVKDISLTTPEIWQYSFGLTNYAIAVDGENGFQISTNRLPDGSYLISASTNGLRLFDAKFDSTGSALGGRQFEYDPFGRAASVVDARNGSSSLEYDDLGRVKATTTPAPAPGFARLRTETAYDAHGQPIHITAPDGGMVTNKFHPTGEIAETSGSRQYPSRYEYDHRGRVSKLITWQNFANDSGKATNLWTYDPFMGVTTAKIYTDGTGPTFERYKTNGAVGRLKTRLWDRGVAATYDYDAAGALQSIDYSDDTPDVTYAYDRAGHLSGVVQGTNSWTFIRNPTGQVVAENASYSGATNLLLSYGYDPLLRLAQTTSSLDGTAISTNTFGYDLASRLVGLTNGASSWSYGYAPDSDLIESLTAKTGGSTALYARKTFDALNRLTSTWATNTSGQTMTRFDYAYNTASLRTGMTNAAGERWSYGYDTLGQVTSGRKQWSDGRPVAGQQFTYVYDDIGNRLESQFGGNAEGKALQVSGYTPNALNQYSARSNPGVAEVFGRAATNATVTVNYERTERQGEYFHRSAPIDNSGGPVWAAVTNIAVLNNGSNPDIIATNIINRFIPAATEELAYDANGNLKQDGRWVYTWDGENRLVRMESHTNAPAGSVKRLDFQYDHLGRRLRKTVYENGSSTPTADLMFVYSDWNLIAELNATNNAVVRSYVWGLDLSGLTDRAGGVGGLLAVREADGTTHLTGYDGNGNVSVLIAAATGETTAQYEYDPFGGLLRASGPSSKLNPFRFSTKYHEEESDFNYYGFRYYRPSDGSWLSRDPFSEHGGLNLTALLGNNAVNQIDFLGLADPRSMSEILGAPRRWEIDVEKYNSSVNRTKLVENEIQAIFFPPTRPFPLAVLKPVFDHNRTIALTVGGQPSLIGPESRAFNAEMLLTIPAGEVDLFAELLPKASKIASSLFSKAFCTKSPDLVQSRRLIEFEYQGGEFLNDFRTLEQSFIDPTKLPVAEKQPVIGVVRPYNEAQRNRIPGYDDHHLDPPLGRNDPNYATGPTTPVRNDNAGGAIPGGANYHTAKGGLQQALNQHIKELGYTRAHWNALPEETRLLHLRRYYAGLGIPFPL